MKAGEIPVVKVLAEMFEGLLLITRTHVKIPRVLMHACNSSALEVDPGGSLELSGQQSFLTNFEFEVNERLSQCR